MDLDSLTDLLKSHGVKGSVRQLKKSLYIRGTFYHSDGTKKRVEIPLSLEAHGSNIQLIRDRIHDFARIYRKLNHLPENFPWQRLDARDQPTFANAIAAFEKDYWEGKKRTSETERTLKRYQSELHKLKSIEDLPLSVNDLVVTINMHSEPDTRKRLEMCKVYKRMSKLFFAEGELKELDKIRGKYQAKQRTRFDENAVVEAIDRLYTDSRFGWLTAAQFVYGTRPIEAFTLLPRTNGTAFAINCPKAKAKHEKFPLALGIEENGYDPDPLIERWVIYKVRRDWEWNLEEKPYDAVQGKKFVEAWRKWWKRNSACEFDLVDMRHYWGIRSIGRQLDARHSSKSMGHSLEVHYRTYNSTYAEIDAIKAAADLRK